MARLLEILLVTVLTLLSTARSLPIEASNPHTIRWRATTPAIPLSEVDNAASLPDPDSQGYQLKYVALGLGTQNYSCASGAAAPTAVGAVARLFDATQYLSYRSSAVDTLPKQYLQAFENQYSTNQCSNPSNVAKFQFPCQDTVNGYLDHLSLLGNHFFTSAGVPSFDLKYANPPAFLSAKKVGSTPAPPTAYAGSKGEGAVAWLYLADNGSGASSGLKAVYRIETAGGNPPASCSGQPQNIYVPYAAEYWFYD